MAISVDYSADFPVDSERLHGAFVDEGYWKARVLAVTGPEATVEFGAGLDEEPVHPGWFSVRTTHPLPTDHLPPSLSKLASANLTLRRCEHWGQIVNGAARGLYTLSIPGTRVQMRGEMTLTPNGGSSAVRYTGEVGIKMPILAKRVESFFAEHLVDLLDKVRIFTVDWLSVH